MAKGKQQKAYVSPQAPFESTSDVETEAVETPDIQAFRAYNPDTTMLKAATDAQFERARSNVTDNYGAYSGIPSQVARNRLRDEALNDLEESRALALAEGSERAQALKMSQLQALAQLTGKTRQKQKQSGYNTTIVQPQQGNSNVASSLISGGATVGAAAIIA